MYYTGRVGQEPDGYTDQVQDAGNGLEGPTQPPDNSGLQRIDQIDDQHRYSSENEAVPNPAQPVSKVVH